MCHLGEKPDFKMSRLPNYIRSCRKRSCLTQKEVAFILGSKSGASVSRHERFKQTPDLQTLLAYELLFRTPVRSMFISTHEQVAQKLRRRIRLLIRKLTLAGPGRRDEKKIGILAGYLGDHAAVAHAQ
jgi:transcriptional regulator with XRE-family HTH domain